MIDFVTMLVMNFLWKFLKLVCIVMFTVCNIVILVCLMSVILVLFILVCNSMDLLQCKHCKKSAGNKALTSGHDLKL